MKKNAKKSPDSKRFFLKIKKKMAKTPKTAAIILAGGSGSRFGGEITKQWIFLDGVPVVIRSVLAFAKSGIVDEIIISAKADEIPLYGSFLEEYKLGKIVRVVSGGKSRGESALSGFKAISDTVKYVIFHDAARCLVTKKAIVDTLSAAKKYRAACAATRSRDTVKFSEKNELVSHTIDRNNVWLAQTPQAFLTEVYRASAYQAVASGFVGTDDSSLVENVGFSVKLVETGAENIKITTKSDFYIAEAILKMRAEEEKSKKGLKK